MKKALEKRRIRVISSKVIKLFSQYTSIARSNITAQSRLIEDLGLSSLDVVSIICELEELFSIVLVENDNLYDVKTVQDVIDLITKKKAGSR